MEAMTRHGTAIPWLQAPGYTAEVLNVVTGCTPVGPGCDNCWARALHERRHGANRKASPVGYAPALARKSGFELPCPQQYDLPFSKVQLHPDRLDQPLHWRSPRMVMVPSMGDLFHEDVPFTFLDRVMETIQDTPRHIYPILTKRPGRMRDYFHGWHPAQNLWLGVSVEDQDSADERIPLLLRTPAAKHFVSAEPLLGPLNLDAFRYKKTGWHPNGPERVDWLIVGGESGPNHRPMALRWVEKLRVQCDLANVPYFGKQQAGNRSGIALPGRLGERSWPL